MYSDSQTYVTGELIKDGKLAIGDGYRAKNIELAGVGIPFARAGNIDNGFLFDGADRFPEEDLAKVGEKISRPGDVVFTSKGTVGRFAFVREETPRFVFSPQLCYWRSLDTDFIDPHYLYYWMNGREFWAQASAVKGETDMADYVSLTDQRRMKLTLPPISVQREIRKILGALDDKIELNHQMNHTLEAMAQAIFKSWFVDFDPVTAKAEGRQPYGMKAETSALFPSHFVESELGPIPEGWEPTAIGDLCNLTPGRSYASKDLQESTTALVTLKSFERGGGYKQNGLKPYTGKYKDEQVVNPGELIVARTDVTQNAEVIGRPAIVRGNSKYNTLVASLDVMIVRSNIPDVGVPFLYCLMRNEEFVGHIVGHANGTTVLHLSKDGIPAYRFAKPSSELCKRFDDIAQPIFKKFDQNEQENGRLSVMRDMLLPKLLSGEIRVKHTGKQAEAVA